MADQGIEQVAQAMTRHMMREVEAREQVARLEVELREARDYLREKNEIIKAFAGPTGMTPEDVAHAVALGRTYSDGSRAKELERERDELAQAMWEARAILGFDNDGDSTPDAMIAGMGWDGFRAAFLRDMREQRQAYDEALDEIPDTTPG